MLHKKNDVILCSFETLLGYIAVILTGMISIPKGTQKADYVFSKKFRSHPLSNYQGNFTFQSNEIPGWLNSVHGFITTLEKKKKKSEKIARAPDALHADANARLLYKM